MSARNAITSIARESLQFKAEELLRYADSQWSLLVENDFHELPDYVDVARESVARYASGLVRSGSELIAAAGPGGVLSFSTSPALPEEAEQEHLAELARAGDPGWIRFSLGSVDRVGQTVFHEPFGWMFIVSEEDETFYRVVREINRRSVLILAISAAASLALVFLFTRSLLGPLGAMAQVMGNIVSSGDLSRRVKLLYSDEIGDLGYRFNQMTGELEKAYGQIKNYAYKAVIARKQEQKIRSIFQKYVPIEVIEEFFANPESLLKGDNRELAVLFSDIRSFTSISESLSPEEVVSSLNAYFSLMVEIVMRKKGVVDKYIGDAIMAFFGAPVKHDNDPELAVAAAFEMLGALRKFNEDQKKRKAPVFTIGIGISYGTVTIGNIGSEKKMDYTVIGDMVNLASRLEELTKVYKQPLLVSGSVALQIHKKIPCRLIDRVRVKGKQNETRMYAPRERLDRDERQGWTLYNEALKHYYRRDFPSARNLLEKAGAFLPGDSQIILFSERCDRYSHSPLPPDWDGVVSFSEAE